MSKDLRYMLGGAALGTVLGAVSGWAYMRYGRRERLGSGSELAKPGAVDTGKVMRLGITLVSVVRQLLDMR
ncbi:MAG: hypothetical protein ACYC5M_13970 [Anaerolineae bacterium]